MKRAIHLFVVLILLCALPASAVLQKSASGTGVLPDAPEGSLLYDQNDNPQGNGASSQNFEAALNGYDTFAADDFVVTDAAWDITGVNTAGVYFNGLGPMGSVNVTFYANSPGGGDPDLPGAVECTYSGIVPGDAAGSLTITLPATCSLAAGTHWVEVQANMDFAVGGQWAWSTRTVQSGSESVWRNPGNGFGTGCVAYAPLTVCIPVGLGPDFMFQIEGTVGVASSSILAIPTLSVLGMVGLGLLMLAVGFFALRRRTV